MTPGGLVCCSGPARLRCHHLALRLDGTGHGRQGSTSPAGVCGDDLRQHADGHRLHGESADVGPDQGASPVEMLLRDSRINEPSQAVLACGANRAGRCVRRACPGPPAAKGTSQPPSGPAREPSVVEASMTFSQHARFKDVLDVDVACVHVGCPVSSST